MEDLESKAKMEEQKKSQRIRKKEKERARGGNDGEKIGKLGKIRIIGK